MIYLLIKLLHLTVIAAATVLFIVRFYWQQRHHPAIAHPMLVTVSHSLNGLVILSGALLCLVLNISPLNNATPWLTEKLAGTLVLAFLAAMTLRWAKNSLIRWCSFFGVLGWIFFIAKLAFLKQGNLFG